MDKEQFLALESRLAPLEREWYFKGIDVGPAAYPWVPLPLVQFGKYLAIAMKESEGPFVDLGAGIGTKVIMAKEMGLQALGYENNKEYLAEAHRLGADVIDRDIRSVDVVNFGVVYIHRPLRPDAREAWFEGYVQGSMHAGSVLICCKASYPPPESKWKILSSSGHGENGNLDYVALKMI